MANLGFPEDDELERELADTEANMDMMKRDFAGMDSRRHQLRKQIQKRQIDPLVVRALQLAQSLGHALGANEALDAKVKHLVERIDVRDEALAKWQDHDQWKERAEKAEATLIRSRAARKRR